MSSLGRLHFLVTIIEKDYQLLKNRFQEFDMGGSNGFFSGKGSFQSSLLNKKAELSILHVSGVKLSFCCQ